MKRRGLLSRATLAIGAVSLTGCGASEREYERAAESTWTHAPGQPALMKELVRYASLAPSSHNTQCWKFRIGERTVSILPDFARRCPAVDPDDHHLFVSLGCAAENLNQAALAKGYRSWQS